MNNKKPSYRQLKKNLEACRRENVQLQQYLSVSREQEKMAHEQQRRYQTDAQTANDKLIAANRSINNLRQIIKALAIAAVRTNEALEHM